jgi:hypothetical protein
MDISPNPRQANKNNIQQVADDSQDCTDSTYTKGENDRDQSVQNREDELKLRDNFRRSIEQIEITDIEKAVDSFTEAVQVRKGTQINRGSGLELTNTVQHDSSDLDHDARDSVRGARVTLQAGYTFDE